MSGHDDSSTERVSGGAWENLLARNSIKVDSDQDEVPLHDPMNHVECRDSSPIEARTEREIAPHEYICINRPLWDEQEEQNEQNKRDNNNDDWFILGNDGADSEEDVISHHTCNMHNQLAIQNSEWRWVMMRQSWDIVSEYRRRTSCCDPDLFGMYINNDFYAYGLQELQENILVKFDEEYRKDDRSFEVLWAIMAGMMHWQLEERSRWLAHDDGTRASQTTGLIGCAFLTLLEEVRKAGQLKADSVLRDLDLVMCMSLEWGRGQANYNVQKSHLTWPEHVVAYARKSSINLKQAPLHNSNQLVDDFWNSRRRIVGDREDRWSWRARFKRFVNDYGEFRAGEGLVLGGCAFDITKMTREERVSRSFDNKDPLADCSDDDLQWVSIPE